MKNLRNYQLLILAALVATLANGVWFLPALSWVYPVFLMLFTRRCSVLKGALFGVWAGYPPALVFPLAILAAG